MPGLYLPLLVVLHYRHLLVEARVLVACGARRRIFARRIDRTMLLEYRVPTDNIRQRSGGDLRIAGLLIAIALLPESGRVFPDHVRVLVLQPFRLGVADDPHQSTPWRRGDTLRRRCRLSQLLHTAVRLAAEESTQACQTLMLLCLRQVQRVRPTAEVEREATRHRGCRRRRCYIELQQKNMRFVN